MSLTFDDPIRQQIGKDQPTNVDEQVGQIMPLCGNFYVYMETTVRTAFHIGMLLKEYRIPPERLTDDFFSSFPPALLVEIASAENVLVRIEPEGCSNNEKKQQK